MAKPLSEDLRRRIVDHYNRDAEATYESTALHFSVGEASVSRLLSLFRKTGDIKSPEKEKKRRFKVDLDWLKKSLDADPNARLIDRAEQWEKETGVSVSVPAMWGAVTALGFTHKKRLSLPKSENLSEL